MIELILGPMFVGKSTLLHQRFKRAILQGERAVCIIPEKDIRYSRDALSVSHDGGRIHALRAESLVDDPPGMQDATAIFIDEGHFFPGLASFCLRHSKAGKRVCVAALNADYKQRPWDEVARLLPAHVHNITALTGVCIMCCGNAYYSRRIHSSENDALIDVGADEKYVTTCAAHFDTPLKARHIQMRADLLKKIKV